jgi:GT2 family glycosyltransferase
VSGILRKENGPGVSVVIPTHNRAHLVTRAIDSALKAVSPCDEIITIDDGSTDDTEILLKRYKDSIRYVKTENRGAGAARNLGIDMAKHDWIAFLDSDDEWTPDHLDLHRAFLSVSDVLFSFSNFDVWHDHTPEKGLSRMRLLSWTGDHRSWDQIIGPGVPYSRFADLPAGKNEFNVHIGCLYHLMLKGSYTSAVTSVIRGDLVGDRVRFPVDLSTFEDYDYFVRLTKLGNAAYLDCSTAINHGHTGPRLTDFDDLTKIATRVAILKRSYGADIQYLAQYRAVYETALNEMEILKIKNLISQGQTPRARNALQKVKNAPWGIRFTSMLPGFFLIFLKQVFHYLKRMAKWGRFKTSESQPVSDQSGRRMQ